MYQSNNDLLTNFGINLLTGEADKYGIRILCDVSDRGKQILCEFLSVDTIKFFPNWNSRVGDADATGSFLLGRNMIDDLVTFLWFYKRNAYAISPSGFGYTSYTEADVNRYCELYNDADELNLRRNWNHSPTQPSCDRNEHAFSGRTV